MAKTEYQRRKEYAESLLQIEVSAVVALASKPMPVEQITKLAPGMMVQFQLSSDSPLTLEVDEKAIATGEVVKVGDKFGFRVGEIAVCGQKARSID